MLLDSIWLNVLFKLGWAHGWRPFGAKGAMAPPIRKQFTNQEWNIGFDNVYFSSLYGGCVVDHQGYKPTHLYQGKL